jgi:hypothetical protein
MARAVSAPRSNHLEPEAACDANEAVGLSVQPEPLPARSDFLENGGGDVKNESEFYSGVNS